VKRAVSKIAEVSFFLIACFCAAWLPLGVAINLGPFDPEVTDFGALLIRLTLIVPFLVISAALFWVWRTKAANKTSN
jgi:uncharacterized BrkB/YihY/UPF0761 family membrane protein